MGCTAAPGTQATPYTLNGKHTQTVNSVSGILLMFAKTPFLDFILSQEREQKNPAECAHKS